MQKNAFQLSVETEERIQSKKLIEEFPNPEALSGLNKLSHKIDTDVAIKRKFGSGKNQIVSTNEDVYYVE